MDSVFDVLYGAGEESKGTVYSSSKTADGEAKRDDLRDAVAHKRLVGDGESFSAVATNFGVHRNTLRAHVDAAAKGQTVPPPGRAGLLTMNEEEAIIVWLLFLARIRFPATKRMIWSKAREIANLVCHSLAQCCPYHEMRFRYQIANSIPNRGSRAVAGGKVSNEDTPRSKCAG